MKYNRKSQPRRLKCKQCGIFKNNRTSLQDHINLKCDSLNVIASCIDCDQIFTSERSFKRHYKRHYENERLFFNECVTLQKQDLSVLLSYSSKQKLQDPDAYYSCSSIQNHFVPGDIALEDNQILVLNLPSTTDDIVTVFNHNGLKGSMSEVIGIWHRKLISPNVLFATIDLYVEICIKSSSKKCIMIPVKNFMQKGESTTALYNSSFVWDGELHKNYNCIIVPIFVNVEIRRHFFLVIFDIAKNESLIYHSQLDIISEGEVVEIKDSIKALLNLKDIEFTTIMMKYSKQWDNICSGLFVFQYVKDYMSNTMTVVKHVDINPIKSLMFQLLAENGLLNKVWKKFQNYIEL